MSNFDEQLHSPKAYVILGVIDGLVNTKPYMDNQYYNKGYQVGNKEYQAGQLAESRLDQIIKKQSQAFDKQMISEWRKLDE